jgi:membrane-associated protease RseP (regulator of RpoE activity)
MEATTEPYRDNRDDAHAVGAGHSRGPGVHIILFSLTFLTTAMAGVFHAAGDLPFELHDFFSQPLAILAGFPFAITVMTILLSHEMGHYVLARAHRVDASLPYFIPAPPTFLIGTFGAFIRIRTLPPHRRALFDIGAAGPWAGFLVAVPAVIFGLQESEVRPLDPTQGGLMLGDSLLFSFLTRLVLGVDAQEVTIQLGPVALAGWFGLLVTCLNLLPVGQLDGGHVAYAVFGNRHHWISRGAVVALVILGIGGWPGWFVWAALLMILGLRHPRPWDPATPLDRRRLVAAAATLVVFALTFMPEPITIVEPTKVYRPHHQQEEEEYQGDGIPISAPARRHGFVIAL